MKRARIVQVSPFHPQDLEMGGPLHLVAHLATERNSSSFESIGVVAPASNAGRTESRFKVYECKAHFRYRTVSITRLKPLIEAISGADVVLIHGYRHWLSAMAAREAVRRQIPFAVHLHGMATRLFRSRIKKLVFDLAVGKRLAENARRVVCSSQAEMDKASRILNSGAIFSIIPNAIEPTGFHEHGHAKQAWCTRLGMNPGEPLAVALGRINSTKNYEAIIAAIATLPGTNLVVAGPAEEPRYWESLRSLAHAHCGNRVRLIPGVYGDEKHSLLAAADVFATATRVDSFNLTVAEAIFQGTPVVFPSWIGIAEFVKSPIALPVSSLEPAQLGAAISAAIALGRQHDSSGCPFTWANTRPHWDRLFGEMADSSNGIVPDRIAL